METASPVVVRQPAASGPLRRRLLERIGRRYRTVTEAVRVGPLELSFTRVADPNRVLDEVAEEEDRREKLTGRRLDGDSLHLPYWAEVWDSALGVGEFLMRRGWRVGSGESEGNRSPYPPRTGCNTLDLGCGQGLAGTVAAALGARVLLADLEPPALLFARLNSLPYAGDACGARGRPRVRTRRVDWRGDRLGERFDLVIGSDILYDRKQWDHLEPFWRAHLAEGGAVLLGEPGRQTGEWFPAWIGERGWSLETFQERVEDRGKNIRLFLIRPHGCA